MISFASLSFLEVFLCIFLFSFNSSKVATNSPSRSTFASIYFSSSFSSSFCFSSSKAMNDASWASYSESSLELSFDELTLFDMKVFLVYFPLLKFAFFLSPISLWESLSLLFFPLRGNFTMNHEVSNTSIVKKHLKDNFPLYFPFPLFIFRTKFASISSDVSSSLDSYFVYFAFIFF